MPDSFPPPKRRGGLVALLVLGAGLVAAGVWFSRGVPTSEPVPETLGPAPEAAKREPMARAPEAEKPAPPDTAPPAPATGQDAPPPPDGEGAPGTGTDAAPFVPFPEDEGGTKVVVTLRPLDAKIYYKGREVGGSPFTLTVKPGKRRNFEVVKKGFLTRKLRVDGSRPNMIIGLRPVSDAMPRVKEGAESVEGSPP